MFKPGSNQTNKHKKVRPDVLNNADLENEQLGDTLQTLHVLYAISPPIQSRERVRRRVFDSAARSSIVDAVTSDSIATTLPDFREAEIPCDRIAGLDKSFIFLRPHWVWFSAAAFFVILLAGLGGLFMFFQPGDQPSGAEEGGNRRVIPAALDSQVVEGGASPDFSATEVIWETDSFDSPLSAPLGVTVDKKGNLLVVDAGLNQILEFDKDGQFTESWGRVGGKPGEFQFDYGNGYNGNIAVDTDGNIYVFDFANSRIQKFDAQRNFLIEWGGRGSENGQFLFTLGTVDATERLVYASDLLNNRIQVFDLDGNLLDTWKSEGDPDDQFENPTWIAIGRNGVIYVAERGGPIQTFDTAGNFLGYIGSRGDGPGELLHVNGLAVDQAGNIFVSDGVSGQIQVLRSDGAYLGAIDRLTGVDELAGPAGLAFDSKGYLYIADELSDRVLKVKLPPIR